MSGFEGSNSICNQRHDRPMRSARVRAHPIVSRHKLPRERTRRATLAESPRVRKSTTMSEFCLHLRGRQQRYPGSCRGRHSQCRDTRGSGTRCSTTCGPARHPRREDAPRRACRTSWRAAGAARKAECAASSARSARCPRRKSLRRSFVGSWRCCGTADRTGRAASSIAHFAFGHTRLASHRSGARSAAIRLVRRKRGGHLQR